MQTHKDQSHDLKRKHLSNTVELQYYQLQALHEVRNEHLARQHASEWDNQIAYSKKAERELRKKHVLELKEHPKSMKVRYALMLASLLVVSLQYKVMYCTCVKLCSVCIDQDFSYKPHCGSHIKALEC